MTDTTETKIEMVLISKDQAIERANKEFRDCLFGRIFSDFLTSRETRASMLLGYGLETDAFIEACAADNLTIDTKEIMPIYHAPNGTIIVKFMVNIFMDGNFRRGFPIVVKIPRHVAFSADVVVIRDWIRLYVDSGRKKLRVVRESSERIIAHSAE